MAGNSDSLYTIFDHTRNPIGPDGTPYHYYEALRDEAARTSYIGWSEQQGGHWVVTGYEECYDLLQNHEGLSNAAVLFPDYDHGQDSGMWLGSYDEPKHKQHKNLVAGAFSPGTAARYESELREMTSRAIDQHIESGHMDIARTIGDGIPSKLVARILGLPEEMGDTFIDWCSAIARLFKEDPAAMGPVIAEVHEFFTGVLDERRRKPGDDLLSMVVHSEINGERLSHDDLLGFSIVMLTGGIDTGAKGIASALWRLAWDRELRRRLAGGDQQLISGAVDEFLRYYSPASLGRLVVDEDLEISGVKMKKGQVVVLALPIANRDARQFTHPDAFLPERSPNRHLALGSGIHRCLGAHIVRVEARAVITEFLRRIPDFELDPANPAQWTLGQIGGMGHCPIVFEPQSPRSSVTPIPVAAQA